MPKLSRIGLPTAVALLLTLSCSNGSHKDTELVVFAASSLTEAFQEAVAAFEMGNPDVKVSLNFDGSQRLSAQLTHGAGADLFASADWLQMDAVAGAGLVQGKPVNFASNSLVMIASTAATENPTLEYLAQPGTKVVLAQASVPVGNYSRQVLQNLQSEGRLGSDYSVRVLANLVSEETNVRNVAQKVALGEADAGIVYRTDASAGDIKGRVVVVDIPEPLNVIADYPIAAMKDSQHSALAQRFIDFVLTEQGQTILQGHGFGRGRQSGSTRSSTLILGNVGR